MTTSNTTATATRSCASCGSSTYLCTRLECEQFGETRCVRPGCAPTTITIQNADSKLALESLTFAVRLAESWAPIFEGRSNARDKKAIIGTIDRMHAKLAAYLQLAQSSGRDVNAAEDVSLQQRAAAGLKRLANRHAQL